jgi:hypothetical protein
MSVEQSMEWSTGETELIGENLPQYHFVRHKSHMTRYGLKAMLPWWGASDYPLELIKIVTTILLFCLLDVNSGYLESR